MRRAGVVLWVVAIVVAASGCASADHSWKGELTARLEGTAASIEEALSELGSNATKPEEFRSYANLARKLIHESELIESLNAPSECSEVQVKGLDHVESFALFTSEVQPPDFPRRMLRAGRISLEGEVRALERIQHEAETCA